MRYAISLTRRAAVAVAAGTLASGALLFTAGALVGSAAAKERHALANARAHSPEADSANARQAAAADSAASLTVYAPGEDCPPAAETAEAASYTPARHRRTQSAASPRPTAPAARGDADAPGLVQGRTVGTFRDEERALTARQRYEAIGVEAVIEAWAGADGEPVFRVVVGEAP